MPYTESLPKPLIRCNGKPFLEYLLQQLIEQGIKRCLLLTGYFGEQIKDYFGNGDKQGLEITYFQGPVEWDTGRRIWESQLRLDERFLLLYSDNFVPFPFAKIVSQHEKLKLPITLMVSPKSPGNLAIDESGVVQYYDDQRSHDLPYVEIGYMVVERDLVIQEFPEPDCSFSVVLRRMAAQQRIGAWVQKDAYHSISDPERWNKAEQYLQAKRIVLIDRDGVINHKAPPGKYINCWEDFNWIDSSRNALKRLAKDGYCFIVISNQAGIARGVTQADAVERIHKNMIASLSQDGVNVLKVYVCPHHWDDGCECRKPKPGMLLQAAKDYLLRLDKTCFVGDDLRDMEAADRAGCKGILFHKRQDLVSEILQCMNPSSAV